LLIHKLKLQTRNDLHIRQCMKLNEYYEPQLPSTVTTRQLHSTYHKTRNTPVIEMKLLKDAVEAKVTFEFFLDQRKETISHVTKLGNYAKGTKKISSTIKKIITGPSDEVYSSAVKLASRISLTLSKLFNDEWQKSLMNLLNKPSKNKTILNLGLYKNNQYGIYDIVEPKNLLAKLMFESDIKQKDLAYAAEVDKTTLWRHLNGTLEISRDAAIKYAKVLGCDPAKILFNDLTIPMWGSTDTHEMQMMNRLSIYASEITAKDLGTIECPREIYRPDVKAIRIDSPNSSLHNQVAFYYNSNEPIVLEDQMVIVGTQLKNLSDSDIRNRYFIGIYKKNKDGRTVDLHTIDPLAFNVEGIEPDEDMHSFDHVISFVEDQMKVIEGIEPTFVAPVVAMMDATKVFDPIKQEIQKAYDEIYTASRNQETKALRIFKNVQMKSVLQDKAEKEILSDDVDDYVDQMNHQKLKAFIDADKELQSVISTAAYGSAKLERRTAIQNKVKQIKADLSDKENRIIERAYDRLKENMDNPGPDDEDFPH